MDMCSHGLDPDIVRWGLHLLGILSLSNAGSCCTVTLYAADPCPVEYVRGTYCENSDSGNICVENDEVIAHVLQEELSRLASVEEFRPSDGEDCSHGLEIADESTLDGEVGKRLDQMVPILIAAI